MDTPFGLRRLIMLTFPELRAASVSVRGPQRLHVRYVPAQDGSPDHTVFDEWVKKNTTAGIGVIVECVHEIAAVDLPSAQLDGLSIPLDVAEDAAINHDSLLELLRRRWPDDFVRLGDGPGRVNCVVASTTSETTKLAIQREISLLLHGVAVTIAVDTKNAVRSHVGSRADLALATDWDQMYELCNEAVAGRHKPATLPHGSYAFLPLKQASLFCHLAIAERVYVEVPRTIDEMASRHGVSWTDFVDAMSTGRVVPVFRLPARMYERGMLDVVLDAGGKYVLPGENRLRELAAFVAENPAVALASGPDERWRSLHAAVNRHPKGVRLRPLFEAIAKAAARARMVARRADFMAKTWAPFAFALDDVFQMFGHQRRDLEFSGALDVMTAAQGCGAQPIIPDGDLLGQYVQLLYGVPRNKPAEDGASNFVQEPPIVAKVILERARGISLRQFSDSFNGPAITAMHRLMASPRLADGDVTETVTAFEREMHVFNGRRSKLGAASVGVDGTIALAGLSAGWGLLAVVLTVATKHLLSRPVLTDEQVASLLRSTKEAAYLARIDAAVANR